MPKNPDSGPKEPNLELPSFGLRRRKKKPAGDEALEASEPAAPEPAAPSVPESDRELATTVVENGSETAAAWAAASPPTAPAAEVVVGDTPVDEATDEAPPENAQQEPRPSVLTRVPGPYAAVGAGLVCGLIGIVLSIGSLRGCEAVRGVGTCGGIGLFALLAILVVEIFIGAAILRACRVNDSFSTSFLGVGVAAVIIVLFLLSYLDDWWMLVVVPLVTAAAYLFSWWVTTRFVDVRDDDRHR